MAQTSILRYLAVKMPAHTDAQPADVELLQPIAKTTGTDAAELVDDSGDRQRDTSQVRSPSLPGACIARVQASHVDAIKQLTSSTLPMRYPDRFYREVLAHEDVGDVSRVALFEGRPVGWIRCRLEAPSPLGPATVSFGCQIYVQALCILAPYRQRGLAGLLLDSIVQRQVVSKYGCSSIYAHVWENNEDALRWYETRGFRRVLLVEQYYRRLRPGGAWILRKEID
jgi:N-alpha-acetyltransferase 50